jgi:peroxiredoxin Q/BCP
MLKKGDRAPRFSLESDDGTVVKLDGLKGKTVVLYFYPKDLTPGCTTEACDFRDLLPKFRKQDAVILGVSRDSVERHQKFKDKYGLPFPLLSDEDGRVCEAYGVWKQKSLYGRKFMGIERTTFVIGPDGRISEVYEKVKVNGHAAKILETLKA